MFLVCGWLCRIADESEHLIFDLCCFGLVFHLAAFYWLKDTLILFGGFPQIIACFLFLLYCAVSTIQFAAVAQLTKIFKKNIRLDAAALAFPAAWFLGEFFIPRLFPWSLIHPLISWEWFSRMASYCGEAPLTLLFLWWCQVLVRTVRRKKFNRRLSTAFAASIAAVWILSALRSSVLESELSSAPKIKIGMVQGNLSTRQKGDVQSLSANLETYREVSRRVIEEGSQLVIWPESVMNQWTPETAKNVRESRFDPFPNNSVPLLYGGLSFRPKSSNELRGTQQLGADDDALFKKFNSALAIDRNGVMLGKYHKRVLMPFGEFMPLSETFPWVKEISPHTGDFSVGDLIDPIKFPLGDSGVEYSVSNLICYEDLIPALGREAVNHGAQLLVNLTNDAWYGDTSAPIQHHLLAAWRSIETGRYLLRSTNTGFTAVVDPHGQTVSGLPIFIAGSLSAEVSLLSGITLYSRCGDLISWLLALAIPAVYFLPRLK